MSIRLPGARTFRDGLMAALAKKPMTREQIMITFRVSTHSLASAFKFIRTHGALTFTMDDDNRRVYRFDPSKDPQESSDGRRQSQA